MTKTDRLLGCLISTMGPQSDMPNPTADLEIDLGMDFLDKVEFVTRVEEEFGIQISEVSAEHWKNWGQVVKFIQFYHVPHVEQSMAAEA